MHTSIYYKIVLVIFSTTLNLFNLSHAQELQTKEMSIPVTSSGAEARSEAFQKATEALSFELAASRLGAEFLENNKKRFESEVLTQSSKYILSIKGKGMEGSEAKVELSYSTDAFDRVLRQSGLLQISRQNIRALLLIEEKDQAIGAGPWWIKEKAEMKPKAADLYKSLSTSLGSRGIEVLPFKSIQNVIPSELKKAHFNREELVELGEKLGVSLVYFGLVAEGKKGLIYHGQWIQVPAARILEEVQGEAENQKAAVEEILTPIKVAQTQGTLSSKPFQLTIQGDLNPKELNSLKDQMRTGVRDLRSMKVRLVKSGEFTFEAESPQSPKALADIIKTLSFQDFQHRVSLNGEDEILLRVEKR